MARQKKDGRSVSFYINREVMEKVEAYASERGQTLTMAVERLLEQALDDKSEEKPKQAEPSHESC